MQSSNDVVVDVVMTFCVSGIAPISWYRVIFNLSHDEEFKLNPFVFAMGSEYQKTIRRVNEQITSLCNFQSCFFGLNPRFNLRTRDRTFKRKSLKGSIVRDRLRHLENAQDFSAEGSLTLIDSIFKLAKFLHTFARDLSCNQDVNNFQSSFRVQISQIWADIEGRTKWIELIREVFGGNHLRSHEDAL